MIGDGNLVRRVRRWVLVDRVLSGVKIQAISVFIRCGLCSGELFILGDAKDSYEMVMVAGNSN